MFKLTYAKVVSQFTKVIDNLDIIIDTNNKDLIKLSQKESEIVEQKAECHSEITRAAKVRVRIAELLDI